MYTNEESYKEHLRSYVGCGYRRKYLYQMEIEDGYLEPENDLSEREIDDQWEMFNRFMDELEDERRDKEYEFQKRMLEKIYDIPSYSPLMHWNEMYQTEEFDGLVPLICIKDLCDRKYVISAVPEEKVSKDIETRYVPFQYQRGVFVVEYESIDAMVRDGWRVGS